MATIVVAHGAWSSAWAWKKMRPLMREAGHDFLTPTYTWLGERAHLASPESTSTHINDILGVLEYEDLRDVVLIGHSYGGMVATGVTDRAEGRIAQLIYLDAFAPKNGQSLFELVGAETEAKMRAGAVATGEGWKVPANPMPPDTAPEDVAWATPKRRPQPIKTFETKLQLRAASAPPRAYIYCKRIPPHDTFGPFAARARDEGWHYAEMDASHNPHITVPQALRDLLASMMAKR